MGFKRETRESERRTKMKEERVARCMSTNHNQMEDGVSIEKLIENECRLE